MDVLVIILVILLAITIFIKREDKKEYLTQVRSKTTQTLLQTLQENEHEIILGSYTRLPDNTKSVISSKAFADIIGIGLEISKDIIEEELTKK